MKLVDEVQEQVLAMIINKECGTEELLNEGDLAVRFEVSRSTIREAVRSLEMRGYVKRIHGKGVKVVDHSHEAFKRSLSDMFDLEHFSISDLLEVRAAIEVAACPLSVSRVTEEEISDLEELVKIMEGSPCVNDDYYGSDFKFHLNFVNAAKNRMMTAIVSAYEPLLYNQVKLATPKQYNIELKYHFHRNILEAIKVKDVEATQYAMKMHLIWTRKDLADDGII